MDKNTAGACLVLIIAAAGLYHDKPWAWSLAAATCALAFLAEELGDAVAISNGGPVVAIAHVSVALLSWLAVILGFLFLFC